MPNTKSPLRTQMKEQEKIMIQAFSKFTEEKKREIPDGIIETLMKSSANKPFINLEEAYQTLLDIFDFYDRTKATLRVASDTEAGT